MSTGGSSKVILFALAANVGIAISKLAGALFSGSAALLAEAVHSFVDSTNQVLLLFGQKRARRPPSRTHPLGYGREMFFWSFMVALLLFSMGGVFAIYEGIHKLHAAEPLLHPWVGLTILVVSVALESASFLACYKEVRANNPYGSLVEWFHRTTSADLLVVFTEDLAALLGLVIALACLLLAWLTGNPAWDAYGSIAVGVLLVVTAALLAYETKSLIIGESPSASYEGVIEPILAQHLPGSRLLRLIAVQTGASGVLLAYKVTRGNVESAAELIDRLNALERAVREKHPEVQWQFVEPDVTA